MIEVYLMKMIILIAATVIGVMAKELKMTRFRSTTTASADDIAGETNEGDDRNIRMVSFGGSRANATGGTGNLENQLSKEPIADVIGTVELARDLVLTAMWQATFELAGSTFGGQVNKTWAFEPGQFPWRKGERMRHHLVSGVAGGTQFNEWELFWEDAVGPS